MPESEDTKSEVARLAEELQALPADDIGQHEAYVRRVEEALAPKAGVAVAQKAALHLLAVCGLEGIKGNGGLRELDRLLAHLEAGAAAAQTAGNSELDAVLRQRRAFAFVRFAGELPPDYLARAAEAFESALSDPFEAGDRATLGVYAFNAALHRLRLRDPDKRRIEELFRMAREHYKSAGQEPRAADAATYLAQFALERLEVGGLSASDCQKTFTEGWRLIGEAMAAISISEDPLGWARRNEFAAALLTKRPDYLRERNAVEAQDYLDRALNVYLQLGDKSRVAACATRLVEESSHFSGNWDEKLTRRFLYYLDLAEAAPGDPQREAPRLLMLANWCAHAIASGAERNPKIAARMRLLGEQCYAMAVGQNSLRAHALTLIGNSWLYAEGSADSLARASTAFEGMRENARTAQEPETEAKALRLLGTALGRRFVELSENAILPRLVETLENAAAVSPAEERGTVFLNLTSILLEGLQRGLEVNLDVAQSAVRNTRSYMASVEPAHRAYLEMLASTVEEFAFGIRPAISSRVTVPARPQNLFFKFYPSEPPLRTLLFFVEADAHTDGRMVLSRTGAGLNASVSLGCTACGARQDLLLALAGAFGGQIACCAACGSPMPLEYFMLARHEARTGMTLIYPASFSSAGKGFALHQRMLLTAVCESWFEEPASIESSLPWNFAPKFLHLRPEELKAESRKASVCLLARGILHGEEEPIRESLAEGSSLLEPGRVEAGELGGMLESLDKQLETAEMMNALIETTRQLGLEEAVRRIRWLWQVEREAEAEFRKAVAIAGDPKGRREFLERFLAETPDYSADRESELYRLLQLGPELEMGTMELEGVPASDPDRYANVHRMVEEGRRHVASMMERDRRENSSEPAKALLSESLSGRKKFVLLLRAFRVDVKSGLASEGARTLAGNVADPRVQWQVNSYNPNARIVENIAVALTPHTGVIMVANASDLMPPKTPTKLFVTDVEWQRLVFALIAEAEAVVMVLRPEELSSGVIDEVRAILSLGREGNTAVVLSEDQGADDLLQLLALDAVAPIAAEELIAKLRTSGFRHIFHQTEFLQRTWELVRSIQLRPERCENSSK